ncbi:MAG: hypothetical protein PHH82_04055 [Candidatus ainarchaeum sp.]|nr:hypothetical protein [Candidatus ainarchaeum sp.]
MSTKTIQKVKPEYIKKLKHLETQTGIPFKNMAELNKLIQKQ